MIEWRQEGLLLSVRKHGETSVILTCFTPDKGRVAGVVRGGTSRKMAPILQPGAQLDLTWKARLADHLGAFSVEPIRARAGQVLDEPGALSAMASVLALLEFALAEHDPHPSLYDETQTLLDLICITDAWPAAYARWELRLLEDLGFGLDLTYCAVTGATQGLAYVSPKSGRAVTAKGAGEFAPRLLPLPSQVFSGGDAPPDAILQALALTGYFLEHWLAEALGDRTLPEARARMLHRLHRSTAAETSFCRPAD